jgi:3-oxoadipate enol-lactonase
MASDPTPDLIPYLDGAKALHIGASPRIAVEHIGDGPLVVFLHGIGGDRSTWAHQMAAFAANGYCAAAWDTRGYGDSDDYDGALSFTDIADDLARVLDAFAVNTAHIVGTSMGGRISLEFYANHPDRFATLTLAGVHASFGSFSPEKQRAFVAARSKPLIEDGLEPADIAPGAIGRLVGPNASEDARTRAIAAASRLHKQSYIKTVEATTQFDREHVLAEIAVPTLVIGGEFDPLTPPAMTRKIAADIDGAEYHLIYDVGHLGNLENPVEFNRLVDQFLARYRDRANIAADPRILAG